MKIIKAKDYEDMSRKASNIISAQVILKPDCVLGLATGSTPIGAYKQLAAWYKKGDVDFAEVSTYNLDEYRGLSHDDPQSPAATAPANRGALGMAQSSSSLPRPPLLGAVASRRDDGGV